MAPVSERLLTLLQCPVGGAGLALKADRLVCPCGLGFPVVDGIPVLLIEQALLPEGVPNLGAMPCTWNPGHAARAGTTAPPSTRG